MNFIKPSHKSLHLSILSIAILASFNVHAEKVERDPILNIQEVIVVKGEGPTAAQSSMTHWDISREEIEASGAQSLDLILANVPGIYVRVGGQGAPRVDIRGFKARHVIYLINGVPANDAEDGQFDPSVIPASQIESVEVSVGPTSVLYGPGGAGGVINIITRQGDSSPSVSGNLEFAENDTINGNVNLAGSGEKWQGFASYNRQQTDGFPMSSDFEDTDEQSGDTRLNADKTVDNFYAQGSYFVSDETMLTANVNYKSGNWGKPSTDGTGTSKSKFERVDDFESTIVQLGFAHKFSDRLALRGYGYHNESQVFETVYTSSDYSDIDSTQDGISTVQGGNLQLIADFDTAGLLTGSIISEKQTWESVNYEANASSASILGSGSGSGSGSGDGSGSSDDFNKDGWLNTLAVEYQYQNDGKYGVTIGGAAHSQERDDADDTNYSAQLSSFWRVTDDSKLHAGIARKVRFPSLRNLYAQSSGNSELEPEESSHVELGLNQGLAYNTSLDITGYYTDAENYIAKDNDGVYQNISNYAFKGVDFSVRNEYFDDLDLTVSYSYLDAEDSDNDLMNELEYRPKHQFRFQGLYQFDFGMSVNLNVEYIADQIYYTSEKISGETVSVKNEMDSYTLVDINLVQPLLVDNLEAYIRATNLLDVNYYQSEALPQAGRQIFVGINWQI
ncbi:TonB-dependent receptor plug domain-containing protein [Shewanella goraebulensis]|uniref:TonB-dependent receptor plug domain-containing protein n=1 Tax=Shewanella goraebulensis TaxID=3050637 RepID=UPI0025511358|nr:TonB-dependent receptor [Shewanella goraebulensis]